MGNDLFNFILSDINGIPSLPIFIGNYLLDLLSTFFPILILLSSFVMVYIGFTRGSGGWKNTAQQVAPTAVSLAVIMSLLSMKTPMSETSNVNGSFWENTNSYTVVEMMNTFLGFGNIFADALTHKMIYGNIDGKLEYKGYFPTVLQELMDRNAESETISNFLKKEGEKEEILKAVEDLNDAVAPKISALTSNLHGLGIVKDYKNTRGNFSTGEAYINDYLSKETFASNEWGQSDRDSSSDVKTSAILDARDSFWLRYYPKQGNLNAEVTDVKQALKNLENNKKNSTKDSDIITVKDSPGKKVVIQTKDIINNAYVNDTENSNFNINLDIALKKYYDGLKGAYKPKNNYSSSSVYMKPGDDAAMLGYLYGGNFELEAGMAETIEEMLVNYSKIYDAYGAAITRIEGQLPKEGVGNDKIAKAISKGNKNNVEETLKSYKNQQADIKNYLQKLTTYYYKYSQFVSKQNQNFTIDYKANQELLNSLDSKLSENGVSFINSINMNNDPLFDKLDTKALKMKKQIKLPIFGQVLTHSSDEIDKSHVNDKSNTDTIANAINNRFKQKADVTLNLYDNFKELLKDDALYQQKMGFSSTAPYNRAFLNQDQYNILAIKNAKRKENLQKLTLNGDVEAKLKEDINKQYSSSQLADKEMIHWTDLGKHYGTFKNLYSPMVSAIYYESQINESAINEVLTLATFMNDLEPTEKANRLLTTAGVFAGGKIVSGVAKTVANPAALLSENKKNGLSDLWDAIKIVGGVYFAILFINVILPAFIWMFVIITYYVEMALYVAVFPIGFMFMIFQSYRQSLHQYINMLLGFILMPIILVSMYFVVLYIDMLLPLFFKQFMPFFGGADEFGLAFKTAFGGSEHPLTQVMDGIIGTGQVVFDAVTTENQQSALMDYIGNMIYTLLSMLMSVLLLMTFFRANEYMSKILNVSTVGMDSFQGRETLNKFGSFDKSGITGGVVGR